jgi:hypothetical protein
MNGNLRVRATISPGGATSPFTDLRRNYSYAGNLPIPGTRIRSPREIVAELHREIAAKSPRHARLVAAFEALPREDEPAWDEWEESLSAREIAREKRRARLRQYTDLRVSGMTKASAARELGIAGRTASEYECDMKAGK